MEINHTLFNVTSKKPSPPICKNPLTTNPKKKKKKDREKSIHSQIPLPASFSGCICSIAAAGSYIVKRHAGNSNQMGLPAGAKLGVESVGDAGARFSPPPYSSIGTSRRLLPGREEKKEGQAAAAVAPPRCGTRRKKKREASMKLLLMTRPLLLTRMLKQLRRATRLCNANATSLPR